MFRCATLAKLGPKAALSGHFDRQSRIKMILPLFESKPLLLLANRPCTFLPAAPRGGRGFGTAAGTGGADPAALALYGSGGAAPAAAGAEATAKQQKHKTINVNTLRAKKRKGEAISMITAYDYPSSQAADAAGVDVVLVGDSVGMVVLGYDSTTPVTMADMLHHCKAVARGSARPFLVGDLPFGSYLTPAQAAENAVRLVKEGGMDCVKLEGGAKMADKVAAIAAAGINVMGHVGLTPQTAAALGGYRVQGKSAAAAQSLVEDVLALQEAGCHAVVLECVPDRIAQHCTALLDIPTIGIGAGPHCDGQVQVYHDVMGMYDKLQPKFSRQYLKAGDAMAGALGRYVDDVGTGDFPNAAESFTMADDHYDEFRKLQQPDQQPDQQQEAPAGAGEEHEVVLQEEIRELRRSLQARLQMLESLDETSITAAAAAAAATAAMRDTAIRTTDAEDMLKRQAFNKN